MQAWQDGTLSDCQAILMLQLCNIIDEILEEANLKKGLRATELKQRGIEVAFDYLYRLGAKSKREGACAKRGSGEVSACSQARC